MGKTLKFVSKYLADMKWKIVLALSLSFVSSALIIWRPKVSGQIVDKVAQPVYLALSSGKAVDASLYSVLLSLSGLILLITVARSLCLYFYRYTTEIVSQSVWRSMREDMYRKLSILDFEFFDKNRTGDIMTKMTSDTEMLRHFSAFTLIMTIENIVLFVGAIFAMLLINPILTGCLAVVVPFVLFLSRSMATNIRPKFHRVREGFSALNSNVQENIGGNRVVKAFAKEDYEIEKFEEKNQDFAQRNRDVADLQSSYIPKLDFSAGMLSVILIAAGGVLAVWGKVSIGDIVTFNGLLWAINNPLRMSGWLMSEMERAAASTERILEFLETEPKINPEIEKPVKVERFLGEVEFKNVTFKYDNDYVLKNISFKVQPGQTVAIVGPTGSGKSTLVNLISRFYDVSEGEVLIDGINVKDVDLYRLRDNIAMAMQDIFLFSDTIEGNIAYGNPSASFDDVKRVSQAADADGFISRMPDGYDTIVGERGVGLSGGQKQRIALARALLKNPSILVLDDTTSAVDMETEHFIQQTLKEYFADRTTFIIAHRISSVKNADLILVLSDGQIIEYGTHENLIKRPADEAYYRSVYENQMGDFDSFYTAAQGGINSGKK
ncbi:MAG: ABC transporter ATP-binding protein/permease [Clostridia bacterium]|nr:ABC transporter ATP-binding protein/permease [Clostridia bacterium]